MAPFDFLQLLAAQPIEQTDHPDWPYWVAIGGLTSALVAVFGWLMKAKADLTEAVKVAADQREKLQTTHAEAIHRITTEHSAAVEAKAQRVAQEFAIKDKTILDTSVEFAKMVERVVTELKRFNDDQDRRQDR